MALLKLFTIITDDSNKSFIPFDDFFRFLKRNDQRARRIDNVRQILKGYKDGIKTVGDQTCVPVISVIRYIFAYSESSDGCLQAAKDIERQLLRVKDDCGLVLSSFNLYKLIAKTKFHNSEILFSRCVLDENDILILVVDHK